MHGYYICAEVFFPYLMDEIITLLKIWFKCKVSIYFLFILVNIVLIYLFDRGFRYKKRRWFEMFVFLIIYRVEF